jgi:transposase-like protein
MEQTAFDIWLSGIAALDEPQRRLAWRSLALSEAGDGGAVEAPAALSPIPPSAGPSTGASQPAERLGRAKLTELGQHRVDSFGCPHCDNRDVVRWGHASDLPRYRCKSCKRTFNALTKTPLANLRMKDKWGSQTQAMIDGCQHRRVRRALRRALHNGVPLAAQISGIPVW